MIVEGWYWFQMRGDSAWIVKWVNWIDGKPYIYQDVKDQWYLVSPQQLGEKINASVSQVG